MLNTEKARKCHVQMNPSGPYHILRRLWLLSPQAAPAGLRFHFILERVAAFLIQDTSLA